MIRKYLRSYGSAQDVGFRYWAKYAAEFADVADWVRNEDDGSASIKIQGTGEQISRVVLKTKRGRYMKIENMKAWTIPLKSDERGFQIR